MELKNRIGTTQTPWYGDHLIADMISLPLRIIMLKFCWRKLAGNGFRINKLIRIRWGKFKPEMNMKRKKHSVEFVFLFEFVPLALGKLVYSEEPFGDGSLRLYVNKLLSLFRPQENKSSYNINIPIDAWSPIS